MLTKDPATESFFLLILLFTISLKQTSATSGLTCYSQPNGAVLPVDSDCHVYIYCLDQTTFTLACPFGMGFNSTQNRCVDLEQSDCAIEVVSPTSIHIQSRGPCDNEKREENKEACVGKTFGDLVPYPGDCTKFLVCNCEYPTVKQCQNGLWFDNTLKVCNYPQNVDCNDGNGIGVQGTTSTSTTTSTTTEGTTTTEANIGWGDNCESPPGMSKDICLKYSNDVLLRYPYDCNVYINCTWGCPVMNYCPPDKVFNDFLKICDTPDTAHCTELPLPPATTTSTTILSTTTIVTSTYSTTEETTSAISTESTSTTTESNIEWGENCESPAGMSTDICLKYSNGVLLRYPYDCNAYINCTLGCPVMNYCPPDKVFNDFLKICDTPDTAHCTELPMHSTTSTEETTTEQTTTELSTTTSTTTEQTTTVTPEQCIPPPPFISSDICSDDTQGIYQPYPYNCTAYIKCKGVEPCLEYCENGKIFNTFLGICDEDIECVEIPLPPPTTTTELPITTTTALPSDVNSNVCRGKEDYTIYPYEKDCSQYLICVEGEVKVENCPQGWLFNAELLLCDKATEEVCYKGPTTTSTTEEPSTTTKEPIFDLCLNQPAGKTFPYKENCELYYYCRGDGQYFIISCPAGNYYDPYTGNCGPSVLPTACTETLTTSPAPTLSPAQKCGNEAAGVTYPYEEDCSQYIYCMGNGKYVIMNCPYNNYYFPSSGDCGPSDNVNICREPTTTTTTTEIAITTTTSKPVLGVCGNYSSGQLIPYPDNCQKYISCVRPIPIGFYCNNDWYFNDLEQTCVPDAEGTCTGLPSNQTSTAATPLDICLGLKEGDWQIYPDNCQFYYECLGDGYYMLKICSQGEYFDPLIGQCSAKVGSDYCKQNFETTLPPAFTTPKPKPQGICANQSLGEKVPYPENCSKYIICESPIPVGVNCAQGLEFSTAAQECVVSSESDCGLLTTTMPPVTKPLNQCTNRPDFTLLPYEQNCGMFIVCLHDLEHWAYCPQGEYFDLLEGQCIKTDNEDACHVNSTTTPTTTTTTEAPITTTTPDPNLGPCYNKPNGTKIPYPNNCTKYIECQYPLNVGYDCPAGLEFSVHYDECVLPELADCSIKTTSTTMTTTEKTTTTTAAAAASETCENKPTGSTLPYPQDCSKYYMCINGQELLTNCMPNSYYDPATGDCDSNVEPTACQASNTTPKPTTSPPSPGFCNNEDNGYIYANEENCSQYYMCLNGTSILCQCQNETNYNPYTKECDSETTSNECKEPLTTLSTTESTNTSTTPIEATTPSSPEHSQDNICCGQKSGTYLPYPNDNSKYVICKYPLPEVYSCAEGSIFDPQSLSCQLLLKKSLYKKPDCTLKNYGETIVYVGDCTKYYFCYGSEAVLLDCSFNWNYDPAIEKCVPKNQYKCPW
ncbi:uncharacterized protein ACRADG_003199 [Cochliomyia hominivorax]